MNLLGLILAVLVVCLLGVTAFKSYFNMAPRSEVANQVKEIAPEQNIDTSSYQSALESIKSQVNEFSQREIARVKEMEYMR